MFRLFLTCAISLAGLARADARASGPLGAPLSQEDRRFEQLVDQYYAEEMTVNPTAATGIGLHEHDRDLEDVSPRAVEREVARLRSWRERLAPLDGSKLSLRRAADLKLLRAGLEANLLELTQVASWRHHPDYYSGLAVRTVYVIVQRAFSPPAERLAAAIAREQRIPAMLQQGKQNLVDVPRISAEIALDELPANIRFLKRDVPASFASVKDPGLQAKLAAATDGVVKALEDYGTFIRTQVLPHAHESFAIGEDHFRAKLRTEEMIDTPLDELLRRGEAELSRLQREFKRVAAEIDAKRPSAEVQRDMQKDHETPEHLIAGTQGRLEVIKKWILAHHIVTLPSEIMPRVEETPPFMRATTMASMDTPGPFERTATEAFYNVTLPEKAWPAAQVEDFLRGAFNRPLIDVVSIHEAFPGHYTQFLWLPKVASKVRKFESANTNVEGWAHYCEQMMLDEGYGDGDKRLRLAQVQDALLRAARYVVGIRMHTRGMTIPQAVDFFQKEGMQTRKVAEMEAKRGAEDPTYLYYTLGKLEILKLRDEYKKKLGPAFTLQKFHDAFLAEGAMPLPLVREALLK
jgi:uncharacterized protein (DUF885 family)